MVKQQMEKTELLSSIPVKMQKVVSVLKNEADKLLCGYNSHLSFYSGYDGRHEVIAHLYADRISKYAIERFAKRGWVIKEMYATVDHLNDGKESIYAELVHTGTFESGWINDELYDAMSTRMVEVFRSDGYFQTLSSDRRWITYMKSYPSVEMFYYDMDHETKITIEDDL